MQHGAHGAPTKLTRISYAYRGISGISEKRDIELAGRITGKQREALFDATQGERRLFIPEQIGLEHLGPYTDWDFPSEGDSCLHELTDVEVLPHLYRSVDPTIEPWESLGPFVDRFVAVGREGWDDAKYGEAYKSQVEVETQMTKAQRAQKEREDAWIKKQLANAPELTPEREARLARIVFGTPGPPRCVVVESESSESEQGES